jgi:choline dehydrogenase-like flavoprotein
VTLASADPTAAPVIELNLLGERADLVRLVDGLRMCKEVVESPAMRLFAGPIAMLTEADFDDDQKLAAYIRSIVAGWYHPVGTCAMGPASSGVAVVDDRLHVHGVEGLRVVDASVMPRICRAPTNLTTMAIAERAVELA